MTIEDVPDYYAEFEIAREATPDVISRQLDQAFRRWSSRASRAPDHTKRRAAEDKVALIGEARKELLDRSRRSAYDRRLDQAKQRARQPPPGPRPDPQPTFAVRNWVAHAHALLDEDDDEGALYELRQAVYHDDRNGDAWRLLGAVHAAQGEYADALQEYERARALYPNDALTHSCIADVHTMLGALSTAANWHVRAAQLAPHDPVLRTTAADSLFHARRYDEAMQQYEHVLRIRPGHTGIRDQIGRIWLLRTEGAMIWNPVRVRYVVASARAAAQVTHCVERALSVDIADEQVVHKLKAYRVAAAEALTKTWRWQVGMVPVVALALVLTLTLPLPFNLLTVLAAIGLLVTLGFKPRWQHAWNELPAPAKQPIGRPW